MECPNCHQPVEDGAAFCGNCGQPISVPISPTITSPIAQVVQNTEAATNQSVAPPLIAIGATGLHGVVPTYAIATPAERGAETKTLLTILAGIVGLVGALFIPLIALVLGIFGLVVGTTAHVHGRRWPLRVGLVLSILALLAGLGSWAYAVEHDSRIDKEAAAQNNAPSTLAASLSTPCYSTNFVDRLNIKNSHGSCDMTAFNGQNPDSSTDAYKVYATNNPALSVSGFTTLAKQAIEKDIQTSLPGFVIDNERVTGFAGSPAYAVTANNKSQGVAVIETAVYHPVKAGENVFIMVHATTGSSADLSILEAQWQWK
jgi:hypothetical protein